MPAAVYRKRPVTIEAVQWTGKNKQELIDWTGGSEGFTDATGVAELWVEANNAWLPLEVGEWVLKDSLGFYPCKNDMFLHSYEPVRN